ncbi:MAG: FAD-binding oxidoreductase [Betaproteobacteria bacterium]|nr:MAG: FAD-binding oxidoreductase [Betaproteobacteria bacterium]
MLAFTSKSSKLPESDTLATRLREHTQGKVLFSAADRARYATDASIYQQTPIGVFVPRSSADVATEIDIARDLKAPILARGGGTSQCGQSTGVALVIDNTKYLRNVIAFDKLARTVTVEPGIVLDHLNAFLKPHGLWFPVDVSTSAQATLGGMAGNNSCGSRSIAYGNMVHNVLGIEAWLAEGHVAAFGDVNHAIGRAKEIAALTESLAIQHRADIERLWPKVMRRVAGYNLDIFCNQSERPYTTDGSVNLAHLLVGSEGTLAFTKSITLALQPLPRNKVLGVVNFPSFYQAMDSAQHIVKLGPTAVELVDRTMIELSLTNPAFAPTIQSALIGKPDAILLVEFSGETKDELSAKLKQLDELIASLGLPSAVVQLVDDAPQKNLWEVRKAGLNIMMSLKGDGKPVSFIEDCAVPLESLAEYTAALTEVFQKHGSRGTWYAHASVGTLHVRPILDMRRDGAAKMRAIAEEASALVRKFKGAYSGEHGDGLCRGEWIEWQYGAAISSAFRAIKNEFDPNHLFNPGKIVDTPKMDDASLFRYQPTYKTIPIKTALDWRTWDVQNDPVTERTTAPGTGGDAAEGFAKAVEMCNNNGHCRKFDAGTMCPSYRVTRDEIDSTRGRANTLRIAVSGQLGVDGIASDEVHEALSLCVSCKGCKRDCPTGVDMAKMKIEHLHHYHAKHGFTLSDKLIAYLPDYAPTAARFSWLLNLRNRMPVLAWIMERTLGFSAKRTLPMWRSDTAWHRSVPSPSRGGLGWGWLSDRNKRDPLRISSEKEQAHTPQVALFIDTFNAAFEPENVDAAIRVLTAAGYQIHIAQKPTGESGNLCCGRTFLAVGMIDEAKKRAEQLLDALTPFAERGIPILGLEPSCLFTLKDEMLTMRLGERAQRVADNAMLIETFLEREAKAGKLESLKSKLQPTTQPILVHGHCHQKAFAEISPTLAVLSLIPDAKPTLIESSCCGMAGAFGYEAKNYNVSMQMAELSLLPTIRNAPEAIIVADGTSCRHQIHDGAAREARHVVRVLAQQLTTSE